MIYLLYQSPWPLGGSTSYTVHLAKVLGDQCKIIRIGKRTERKVRPLGNFGVVYQIISMDVAKTLDGPILLTASNPKQDENDWVELGRMKNVWATFHDPNEFKLYPHWKHFDGRRIICIRETGKQSVPLAKFIPHPYMRVMNNAPSSPVKNKLAVSIARTSSVKNSQWILQANRGLPKKHKIELLGEVNRLWWHTYLKKHYPEFIPHATYPRDWGAGVRLCARAQYMVDLTIFPNDGGGTQYTMLEAIDAGAVPVMTTDWCSYAGPAKRLCFQVRDANDLKEFMQRGLDPAIQRAKNYRYIDQVHNPAKIRQLYKDTLK